MKISILHPSRHRPTQMLITRAKWLTNANNPESIEYLFSFDTDDETIPEWVTGIRGDNRTAIEAINRAAQVCMGDLIVVVSDDMDCEPGWDTALLAELDGREDFVVKTVDLIQKTLVTLPIIDRVWYERFGYVYNPEYSHMGADVELTAVAIITGRLLYSNLVFRHLHYSTGATLKDAVNEKNDLTYAQGDEVLARHRAVNFGIEEPVMKFEEIIWHD